MMIFVVDCDNETSANGKSTEKSFVAQKIRECLDIFDSSDYNGAISLLDEISALNPNTVVEYNLRSELNAVNLRRHFGYMLHKTNQKK